MNRSAIRELTFKLIYSLEIRKEDNIQEQIELYIEANDITDERAIKYITETINGIHKNITEISELIHKNLKAGWEMNRVSKIDISLLKLAIYEIKYTDVPYKVAINEAVELAKAYGEDSTKNFVNGVLASVIREIGE